MNNTTQTRKRRLRPEYTKVQWPITKALWTLGFRVTTLAQPQRVKATPGVPDLYVTHARWGVRLWIECKAPGQKSSARGGCTIEQIQWHRDERAAGGNVIVAYELADVLAELKRLGVPIQ